MINHQQALTLAAAAIDFPLDAADLGALEAHIRECVACRAHRVGFRHDAAGLAALPPIAPPTWVRGAIGHARRSNPVVLLVAAVLLLTASAGITLIVGSALPAVTTYATAIPSGVPGPNQSPGVQTPAGLLLYMQSTPTYQSYQMVRVANADGSEIQTLGTGVEASWAADGRRVHIVSQDADCVPSLITVAPDGSGRVVVSRGLLSLDFGFAWSPDERQIVFLRYRNGPPPQMCGSQGGAYEGLIFDLWLMNADGTGGQVLVPDFQLNGLPAIAWAPDSTRMAFLAPGGFSSQVNGYPTSVAFVRALDGHRSETGTSFMASASTGLAWSPDGARLAASFRVDAAAGIVHVVAFSSVETVDEIVDLTTGDPVAPAMRLGVPIWSPDGTTIAVTSELVGSDGTITGSDIILLDAAKGGLLRDLGLTDVDGFGTPTWSADGRWLAYVSEVQDAAGMHPGTIVEAAIDGNGRRVATGTGPTTQGLADYVTWVAWQPVPASAVSPTPSVTATPRPGRTPTPTYGAPLAWSQDLLPRLRSDPDVARTSDITSWGPGFVIVGTDLGTGDNKVAVSWTSIDGIAWQEYVTSISDNTGDTFTALAVGVDVLVTAGPHGIWRSTDGATWEKVGEPALLGPFQTDITWGPAGFVAIGRGDARTARIWHSSDGRSWDQAPPAAALSAFCPTRIAGGPKGYVAVGSDCADPPRPVIAASSDGRLWARAPEQSSLSGEGGADGVVAGGPGWIAFGSFLPTTTRNRGDAVWTSNDGLVWRRTSFLRPIPPYVPSCGTGQSTGGAISDMTAFGPGYVAVGVALCDNFAGGAGSNDLWGAAWASPDGLTWHSVLPPTTDARFWSMNAIAARDGRLVASAVGPWIDYLPATVSAVLGP